MKKICPICNEEFETNIPNKIYCSSYCSNKRKNLKYGNNKEFHKICECCGKEFISKSNAKYCSNECRNKINEYNNNRIYKKYCKYCNTYFKTKNNAQVYCSEECRENYYKEHQVLNNNKNNRNNNNKNRRKKKYKRICKICGKEFSTNSANSKYCSEKCKQKNKNKIVICKTCGKKFLTIHNKKYCSKECRDTKQKICSICGEKFYTKTGRKYCSDECRKIGVKHKNKISQTELDLRKNNDSIRLIFNGRPINTWYTPGFTEELKNKILERDGFKCYICGKETNLHVHHIIPRKHGGPHIPENLITLCGSCHKSVESGNIEKITKKYIKALKNTKGKYKKLHKRDYELFNKLLL